MSGTNTGYRNRLKKCINEGDFEGIVKNIMLMAVKNNEAEDWKASPRTFMELLQVLSKYRQEFGNDDMADILKLVNNDKE
tara:strand:+ start:90 stop:329 length:240 start_codon:yes stop_codon:yes gene_type:complete